jgi:HNH endonuclease/AP2 domain
MRANILPDTRYLLERFLYTPSTGSLVWRERPATRFTSTKRSSEWLANAWNSIYADEEAGKIFRTHGMVYRRVGLDGTQFLAHRIIWKMTGGIDVPFIDHKDGNGLNNALDNLREATRSQNNANQRGWAKKALPKGVRRNYRRYEARISFSGKLAYLGSYGTAEEAHAAYCEAATRLHGEFANFGHVRSDNTAGGQA